MDVRETVLRLIAEQAGVGVEAIGSDRPLGELLTGAAHSGGSPEAPATAVDPLRLCQLVASIEDALPIELLDHPEFPRLWRTTAGELIDILESLMPPAVEFAARQQQSRACSASEGR